MYIVMKYDMDKGAYVDVKAFEDLRKAKDFAFFLHVNEKELTIIRERLHCVDDELSLLPRD